MKTKNLVLTGLILGMGVLGLTFSNSLMAGDMPSKEAATQTEKKVEGEAEKKMEEAKEGAKQEATSKAMEAGKTAPSSGESGTEAAPKTPEK